MVMLKRRFEYWYTAVALHKIGAIMAPVTHKLTEEDIEFRFSTAGIKAVICVSDDDVMAHMLSAKEKASAKPIVFSLDRSIPGCINLANETKNAKPLAVRLETLAAEPAFAYFTSGTTGQPKGVMHNHVYTLAHIVTAKYWQCVQDGGLHFTVAETGWAKSSWGKIYGQWLAGSAVMVYDFENFDPHRLVKIINRYGVTTFCAPPTIYRYIVKAGIDPMPTLVHATTAGEALNPEVSRAFLDATGLEMKEGYGQTESVLILGNFEGRETRLGSVGLPTPLYRVELILADGTPAAPGEIGEIVIFPDEDGKCPSGLFYDYFEDPSLYEKAWEGGVYHTGDIAQKDEDGYFWFCGRADDMIKTGGYRVGTLEIENVLMQHAAVLECSIIGVPDKLRGQALKAFVVLAPGYTASAALSTELKRFVNDRVADYKWLRKLELLDELPKTVSGKIKKRDLKQEKN
jgi:acetyl-CoA synthetase